MSAALDGRRVLVTGGSSGIGAATAQPEGGVYAASKAAAHMVAETLVHILAQPPGVTVVEYALVPTAQ